MLVNLDDENKHGELTYYNVTQFSIKRKDDKPEWDKVPSRLVRAGSPRTESDSVIRETKLSEAIFGQVATLILTKSSDNNERLMMYEFMTPYLRKEQKDWSEFITSEDARPALIGMVILGTAFYQLYWKKGAMCSKNKDDDADK